MRKAPTRTISAEGARPRLKIRKNAQRERSDTPQGCAKQVVKYAKTHSGSAPTRTIPAEGVRSKLYNAQKRTAGALRHARSPQRVRGRKSICAKTHSGSAPTRTIPTEGARAQIHMRKNTQRERSDTHDPRRGCAGAHRNAQKRTAGALRHARSPQRAKTHSGSAPTRTIPAEGCIALAAAKPTPA